MDGNLAMNSHFENMSEAESCNAYVEYGITQRFPIVDDWDDIDKIYAKGQRDGARWMVSYVSKIVDDKELIITRYKNMLEDVVNELELSEIAIEKHGPLGTSPSELVRLILEEKNLRIKALENQMIIVNKKDD